MSGATAIEWYLDRETRFPYGRVTPDPTRWSPVGFPPPWPDRPWIFGVMVCSANGVVAWQRHDASDDPVLAILGGEDRLERVADRRHMRFLRCMGDASIGAQTVRDQPALVLTPQEPNDEPAPELYRFRVAQGLTPHPRNVVYSLYGRLPLDHVMFNSPGVQVVVVTTPCGAGELEARGAGSRGLRLIVERDLDAGGLHRAHARLASDLGTRYLACEGGETVLQALHDARLLDEVFLTVTDVVVDPSGHDGVRRVIDFAGEGAELVAEGRLARGRAYTFQRWRFAHR